MEIKEKQQKEVEIIKDVLCDCCGKSCLVNGMPEYMSLKSIWGYGTNKDMEKWTAQVCESCVNDRFRFIKFKVESHIFFLIFLYQNSIQIR